MVTLMQGCLHDTHGLYHLALSLPTRLLNTHTLSLSTSTRPPWRRLNGAVLIILPAARQVSLGAASSMLNTVFLRQLPAPAISPAKPQQQCLGRRRPLLFPLADRLTHRCQTEADMTQLSYCALTSDTHNKPRSPAREVASPPQLQSFTETAPPLSPCDGGAARRSRSSNSQLKGCVRPSDRPSSHSRARLARSHQTPRA